MQKMLLALAALATVAACSDAATNVCVKSQECSGKTNEEAVEECNKDSEDEEEGEDKCKAESDELASCLDANGTCDTVELVPGTETKIFGSKASGPDGECEDQAKKAADCITG